MDFLEWAHYEVLGNSLAAWGSGFALALAAWLVLGIARRVLRTRLAAAGERRGFRPLRIAAHTVAQTKGWFLLLAAIAIGAQLWTLQPILRDRLTDVVMIALLIQAGLWGTAALDMSFRLRRELQMQEHPQAVAALDVLGFIARLLVWIIVGLMILDNQEIQITPLIAGLGIGGVAVALATQNILSDLFASLSIVLDKPFVVGDFLSIGDFLGSVEKVGIKTTRIRSLSGEQLIFSNNDLLNSRIRNFGRMFQRRVVFALGVTYQTPPEKLRRIPSIIRDAIEAQEKVRFDRAHFHKYGDFALIFETVYFVLSPEYNQYMDIQQNVNLTIFQRFADEGIDFAYPTQTIHVGGGGEPREPGSR